MQEKFPLQKQATVKHLYFVWPYFRELTAFDIFTRLYFPDYPFIVQKLYHEKYWRGVYFRVSMTSRIYLKIKSSRIKGVLQYILCRNRYLHAQCKHILLTGECKSRFTSRKVPYCVKYHPEEDKQHLFVAGTSDKKIVCVSLSLCRARNLLF